MEKRRDVILVEKNSHVLNLHDNLILEARANVVRSVRSFLQLSAILVVIIFSTVLAAVVANANIELAAAQKSSSINSLTIDGIQCNTAEQLLYHIHAHLDIIINGQNYLVNSQIGIVPGECIHWLHTHDESGIIHIESPINKDFTLGQFFDIWNRKLSSDQIFTYVANNTHPLNVYVNGTKVPSGTNYRDIKLHAHDEIAIVYGAMPITIPSKYDFPPGL